MKREESLLNLICVIGAAGFFALIAYDLFAGGSIISTDGLFFVVVPLVFALSFLAVPGLEFLSRRLEKRAEAGGGSAPQLAAAGGGSASRLAAGSSSPARSAAGGGHNIPALKDARGRAMPPDVNRMVAQMKGSPGKDKD